MTDKQPVTPYQMCINNCARVIRSADLTLGNPYALEPLPDAFACSEVLAIAFCKSKEEVLDDLVRVEL